MALNGLKTKELSDADEACHGSREAGEAQRAKALDLLAAIRQIDGIAHRAAEHEGRAQRHVRALQGRLSAEHAQHAGVAHGQRDDLLPGDLALEQQDAETEHQGRVQVENEALQACADVAQSREVEETCQVVAAESQTQHGPHVAPGRAAACRARPTSVRIRNMGRANNMRYMINVTASTPYRYANLTIMALPEKAIAPRVASSRPRRRLAGGMGMRRGPVFYGASYSTRQARAVRRRLSP